MKERTTPVALSSRPFLKRVAKSYIGAACPRKVVAIDSSIVSAASSSACSTFAPNGSSRSFDAELAEAVARGLRQLGADARHQLLPLVNEDDPG